MHRWMDEWIVGCIVSSSNSDSIFGSNKKRYCSPTDFAVSNNCLKTEYSSYVTATYPNGGLCCYLLRSAGETAEYACEVYDDGNIGAETNLYSYSDGVRPVLQLVI